MTQSQNHDPTQPQLQSPGTEQEDIPIKVVGVGGAGSNALDRIVLDGMERPT